jgi:predicted glycogen debranching enzyme
MTITFGPEICSDLEAACRREWLVTSGTGGYASLTVAGVLTRSYHGLLVAALAPPLGRTVLVAKLEETCTYGEIDYALSTNRWAGGAIAPQGHLQIERFCLEGTVPVWHFACADALVEKRVWMPPGRDTTYVRYTLLRASAPVTLSLKALVNYRDHNSPIRAGNWQMALSTVERGVRVEAFASARPYYLLCDRASATIVGEWYRGFALAAERERGLDDLDDHLHAATFESTLEVGQSVTFIASIEGDPDLDAEATLAHRRDYEARLLTNFRADRPAAAGAPGWVEQLVLAADQFIVQRPIAGDNDGKTVISGYHWFSDWGRDTMIALPGLTVTVGRPEIARSVLRTFARFTSKGMLPNRFPDDGQPPAEAEYNTVDAALWYFEAIRQYVQATGDEKLLAELFTPLAEMIDWHRHGTRFGIGLDPSDGLIHAGEPGLQLTWMDAKVGDWVVTPRIGKPVEINALWYNALCTMAGFATHLGKPAGEYETLAASTLQGFDRFWNNGTDYCYDVIDGPEGNDASLRPNQLFAVSLPQCPLSAERQRRLVEVCGQALVASCGLRTLAPTDARYAGHYGGDQRSRDGAYHQGTGWGWLLGPFVLAHLRVYGDPERAASVLAPVEHHLADAGLGTVSEIFDGDAPFIPNGCIAQAWSVAEVLRAWFACRG